MATNSSLLEDDVVLQGLGPLDEALHSGVTHIWLTFVVACCAERQQIHSSVQTALTNTATPYIQHIDYQVDIVSVLTCDEHLCLTATCEVGQRAFHLTHPHLSAHQVGHLGRDGDILSKVKSLQQI